MLRQYFHRVFLLGKCGNKMKLVANAEIQNVGFFVVFALAFA